MCQHRQHRDEKWAGAPNTVTLSLVSRMRRGHNWPNPLPNYLPTLPDISPSHHPMGMPYQRMEQWEQSCTSGATPAPSAPTCQTTIQLPKSQPAFMTWTVLVRRGPTWLSVLHLKAFLAAVMWRAQFAGNMWKWTSPAMREQFIALGNDERVLWG